MIDIKNDILDGIIKVCNEKKVNFSIFSKNFLIKHKHKKEIREIQEIQKEYFQIINTFLSGIPIHKMQNNFNYSKKEKDKMMIDTSLCFKGIFREFLERITHKYSKDIWSEKKQKNFSKRKMCLG